ncbi:MAG: glycosyltransferase family 4 protein [Anaerolineales bacterium]|nr:glycosyltransferase family 4 protein [Anaerolineales bacterium]
MPTRLTPPAARHILFLLTQDLESPSGLGRYWPLARCLARRGHTVEIAALHPAWGGLSPRAFERDGVRVRYVAPMHIRRAGARRSYYGPVALLAVTTWAAWALARAAVRSRAGCLHIGKAQPMNGLAGWFTARLPGRQLYLDCDDYEAESNRFGAAWQRSVVRWWEDRLPRAARGVTVNTTFLRERCRRLGVPAERLRLVPNGYDPQRFAPPSAGQVAAVRQAWGVDVQPVILYLGSLSLSNHPIGLLLDAWEQVRSARPDARLRLVGGGEDYDRVAQLVAARGLQPSVRLMGPVPPEQAPAAYAASQVVVDPVAADDTARARSPLKVVEALACGVPVVTGEVGDRAAVLAGHDVGRLVTPDSASALAGGLLAVLADPRPAAERAERARQAAAPYRWDNLVSEFEQVYAG